MSDRAALLARLNRQQAQLDRLEALAEENAALRAQLRSPRPEQLQSAPTAPTARRFRTAPGEVQTPQVVVATRREGKVAMVEQTLAAAPWKMTSEIRHESHEFTFM